jgi:hypothetical protein
MIFTMPSHLFQIAAVSLAAIFVPQTAKAPTAWVVEDVALSEAVEALARTPDGVFVRAGEWNRVFTCEDALVCLEPAEPLLPETPLDGIPDGLIVTAASGEGIQRAWYVEPTDRYPHGALGDGIEGGALVAEDLHGRDYLVRLGPTEVFEDLTPRVVDIDGDGSNEVVTIRSSVRAGAAVAVYGISGSRLIERGATEPIGRPNRWLNIAGIADFTGNGQLDIAIVKTPHTGGRLEILAWSRDELKVVDSAEGFSNHVFGSLDQGLSAVASVDGDRIPDLVLPSATREEIRMVTAAGGKIQTLATLPLPARVVTTIGILEKGARPSFATGLDDGSLIGITKQ